LLAQARRVRHTFAPSEGVSSDTFSDTRVPRSVTPNPHNPASVESSVS